VSFRGNAVEARRQAAAALLELHPGYNDLIAAFMRADPLRPYRQTLDLARLAQWGGGRLLLLFTDNPPPADPVSSAGDGFRIVRVCPSPSDAHALVIDPAADLVLPNLPRLTTEDPAAATLTLRRIGAARAQIGSLRGYSPAQASFAHALCDSIGR
jgi:hypothetical protein